MYKNHVNIRNIMTTNVITVVDNDRLSDIATKLSENNISGAPVVDSDGRVVGMVSDGDILRFLNTYDLKTGKVCTSENTKLSRIHIQKFGIFPPDPIPTHDIYKSFEKASMIQVKEVMTKTVITADVYDEVEKVSELMIKNGIKRVPILEDGRLIGIVSRVDIVKYVAARKKAKEFVESR